MNPDFFHLDKPFQLEIGGEIKNLRIAYHTLGQLNNTRDNVVWICHALTANSDVPSWWPEIAGPKGIFSPDKYFIVCANIIGSCYGSTNPLDDNPDTNEPYYYNFPLVTLRDIVRAQNELRKYLGIEGIYACIGGSCGGNQVLEFALIEPDLIQYIFPVACSARETAWSIAIHTTQRMAIEADGSWGEKHETAGMEGMKTARGIGLLSYRTYDSYINTQTDQSDDKLESLRASSYIRYQGKKLADRFNAFSYWHLTKTLDTHHVGRGRGKINEVLSGIKAYTLIIGIDSDILIPLKEQEFLKNHIPDAQLAIVKSPFGHDSFLIKHREIGKIINSYLNTSNH